MGQRVKCSLKRLFYLIFGVLFALLVVRLLIHNESVPYSSGLLTLLAGCVLLLLTGIYMLITRYEVRLTRNYRFILALFLGGFAVIQLICAAVLRYEPVFDLEAVYQGAIDWAETGSFQNYYEYYYFFPNNLGGMAFLGVFFSLAHRLGVTDYYMTAVIVNGLCTLGTMLAATAVCKKALGVRFAVFAMVLFGVSLPFYFMAAVFYTDSLSMLFPVLLYYLYLKKQNCKTPRQRLLFVGLMGIVAALGMLIKFTVVIMLIAIVIDSLLHEKCRRTAVMAGASAAVILVSFLGFQTLIYTRHLDRAEAQRTNTPYLHWVMMGLQGDGGYNPGDYEFTRSFSDPEERDAAIRAEIINRLRQLGPGGVHGLFWRKTVKTFGNGTYCQSDFLDDNPVNRTWLHEFILYEGRYYEGYKHLCQGVFTAILALMALSGLWDAVGRGRNTARLLAPRMAVFGVLLFFAGWEISGRYLTNYVPVIFLGAVMGIDPCLSAAKRLIVRLAGN